MTEQHDSLTAVNWKHECKEREWKTSIEDVHWSRKKSQNIISSFVDKIKDFRTKFHHLKMICRLCLEETEDAIDIESDEGIQTNVSAILDKYFHFCFAVSVVGRFSYLLLHVSRGNNFLYLLL